MTTSPDDLLGVDAERTDRSNRSDRATIGELRRELRAERERSLNATDRVLGAQAEAAQARAEIKELHHLIHVREAELNQVKELLEQRSSSDGATMARSARHLVERAGTVLRDAAGRARS